MVSYSIFQGSVIPQTSSDSDICVTNPFNSDNNESYIPDSCDDDDKDEASFFPSQVLLFWVLKSSWFF